MRVAAIYDIHGNLPALNAVLDEIRRARVDQIVVGGDVFPGPMPRETIERLLELDPPVRFIHGNGDREVLARMRGTGASAMPEPIEKVLRWVADDLGTKYEPLLAGWPSTLTVPIGALGDVLFCHATPRNDTEIFTRLTSADRLTPIFDVVDARVVVCGHTHMQFDRTIGRTRVMNAGSVGMPFGEPGAYWLLLGPDVEFRRTNYDLAAAAERIRGTNYPPAAEFAAGNVLEPPGEAKMLEGLANVQL